MKKLSLKQLRCLIKEETSLHMPSFNSRGFERYYQKVFKNLRELEQSLVFMVENSKGDPVREPIAQKLWDEFQAFDHNVGMMHSKIVKR